MHKETLIKHMLRLAKSKAQQLIGFIHKATGWAVFFLLFLPYMRIIGGLYVVSAPASICY